MTHAEHFLGRLDRLSARHTEEALLLYNDPPLLRSEVLRLARRKSSGASRADRLRAHAWRASAIRAAIQSAGMA